MSPINDPVRRFLKSSAYFICCTCMQLFCFVRLALAGLLFTSCFSSASDFFTKFREFHFRMSKQEIPLFRQVFLFFNLFSPVPFWLELVYFASQLLVEKCAEKFSIGARASPFSFLPFAMK